MGVSSSRSPTPPPPQPPQRRLGPVINIDALEPYAVTCENPNYFQVAIAGKHNIGKTCLLSRYCVNHYSEEGYRSTMRYSVLHHVEVDSNEMIPLQIWDMGGYYAAYPDSYCRGFRGCILAYNVCDRSSFELLDEYVDKLQEHSDCIVCKVLVALQCDRRSFERNVSREEGEELARFLRVPYLEASARNNINVAEIFQTLANAIRQSPGDMPDALGPQLLSAVRRGDVDEVDRLVGAGANINYAERGHGCTPILLATFKRNLRLVRYLLEHGACPDGDMEYGQYYKKPLHWACRRYLLDIAEELIRHGADVNSVDQRGRTPLFYTDDEDRNRLMELAGDFVGLK